MVVGVASLEPHFMMTSVFEKVQIKLVRECEITGICFDVIDSASVMFTRTLGRPQLFFILHLSYPSKHPVRTAILPFSIHETRSLSHFLTCKIILPSSLTTRCAEFLNRVRNQQLEKKRIGLVTLTRSQYDHVYAHLLIR